MKIQENEIVSREEIGELEGKKVEELSTKGGLWLEVLKGGKILSVGSHRAISRHIAKKQNPDLKMNKLAKSEDLPQEVLEINLPEFEELTRRIQELE